MQLEIQKYLKSGKNIQDLIWEYDLQVFYSDQYPNLVCFDYSIISPKSEKIVQEARGLVLDKQNWNVACISMPAFEYSNDEFNYKNARAIEKYDGCLVILYYYENEWITATRFSVDGDCYVASAYTIEKKLKWKDLFYQAVSDMGFEREHLHSLLDKNKCYSFELCSNDNKNIVIYSDAFVKLLSIVDKETFKKRFLDATSEPLNFFMLDLRGKPETRLRKKFTSFYKVLFKSLFRMSSFFLGSLTNISLHLYIRRYSNSL